MGPRRSSISLNQSGRIGSVFSFTASAEDLYHLPKYFKNDKARRNREKLETLLDDSHTHDGILKPFYGPDPIKRIIRQFQEIYFLPKTEILHAIMSTFKSQCDEFSIDI